MAARRVSTRFRIGLFGACVCIGAFLTAAPNAGPQVKGVQVPTVGVPRVSVPQVGVPQQVRVPVVGQGKLPSGPLQLPVLSAEQVAAYTEAAEQKLSYLPGQVLVKFKPGVGRTGQQRALMALRSRPDAGTLEWIATEVALLKDAEQPDARILAQQLAAQPEVVYAEPNYLRRTHAVPNDPSFVARQWNLSAIGLIRAWDISPGGSSNVIVAVIDTGVTSIATQNVGVQTWNGSAIVSYSLPVGLSPDFDTSRFVSPRDFTISATAPPSLVVDTSGHGTHVAGTIGENTNNGVALAGIAYNVRIMPLKVCQSYWDVQFARSAAGTPGFAPLNSGTCHDAAIVAAIRFAADNGASVINMSLGGTSPATSIRDAMTYAVSRGVFIALSNGNEFEDGNPATYPASYAPGLNGVMSVAATNRLNNRSYYSSTGSYTEIAAPGGDSREGNLIWQASVLQTDASIFLTFPRFDRYQEWGIQGTSMASPHVAGVAALLVSRGVTTPATIESILRASAKDIGTGGRDDSFGYGLLQPFEALFGRGIRR